MKDFIKWLGVNEKVAKVVVWLLIIMVTLIIFNTGMESLGFPYYAITYQNIQKININSFVLEYIMAIITSMLSFYAVVLLYFRISESKKMFKYAVLYVFSNAVLRTISLDVIVEAFILIYIIVFSYLYSGKKKKYIIYAFASYCANVAIIGVWYLTKARFINYAKMNIATQSILSLDYFIIMGIIILVKEIYLKKRGENKDEATKKHFMDRRIQK